MEQSDLDLLASVPFYHLQVLAKLYNLSPQEPQIRSSSPSITQEQMAALLVVDLAPLLFETSDLRKRLKALSENERLILTELVECGGRANSRDLALYLLLSGRLGQNWVPESDQPSALYPQPHPHGVFEQSIHSLLNQGLIFWGKQTNFSGRDYANGVYDGVLIVPLTAQRIARSLFVEAGPEFSATPTLEGSARQFQRALYLYYSLVRSAREGLPLISNGLLSRSALRHVVEHLAPEVAVDHLRSEIEVPHLLFTRQLMLHLGLLVQRQSGLYATPVTDFFDLSVGERVRRCYQTWRETSFWNELLYLDDVIVRPLPEPLAPANEELVHSRQQLLDWLWRQPLHQAQNSATIIARAKLYLPYLVFPRLYGPRAERYSVGRNPYNLDFRLRRGWLTHREGWYLVEGGFIRGVIAGPLHWMGLVEVDEEQDQVPGFGRSLDFRLLPGIAALLHQPDLQFADDQPGRLIVQPNFDLLALAPVGDALLYQLDRFAERIRLEQVAQHRLTRQSIGRAIQTGMDTDAIIEQLQKYSIEPLPQNVAYSLKEWEQQVRRIEIWPERILLEVDTPELLNHLCEQEELQNLLGRKLSPVMIEVPHQNLEQIQNWLWQQEYLPAISEAPRQSPLTSGLQSEREPQWRLREDGRLENLLPVEDLFLTAELEQLIEHEDGTNQRYLTPDSLRRALEEGLTLEQVIAFLQRTCQHGIPVPLLIKLKLWGSGYGDQPGLAIEQAPLLRLPANILQDLQADQEIAHLLGSEVPSPSRLVRVAPEHLEQLRDLLHQRGFEVE